MISIILKAKIFKMVFKQTSYNSILVRTRLKQMGENGRRAVKEEFNWGVEEKMLFQLYEGLLR